MSGRRVAILVPPENPAAPADQADTFQQAREIATCLAELGDEAVTFFFGPDREATAAALAHYRPVAVVNLVEDLPEGSDQLQLVPAFLDRLGVRFTGAPAPALAALADKRAMKVALRGAGLPTPADGPGPDGRLIVKSAIEHASIGLDVASVVSGADAAARLTADRQAQFGGVWFAEAFIEGREFNVGLLATPSGPRVLPIAEIRFLGAAGGPRIVGYAEKWAEGSTAYAETPRVFPEAPADRPLLDELARLAVVAWALFDLAGYARLDFRVDAANRPFIVDVNANPCLARDAGFCAAAGRAGLRQTDVVAHLIEAALARPLA
jgi:D-alanine-D-alanine ligase